MCAGYASKDETLQETEKIREAVQNNYEETYMKEIHAFAGS